MPPTVGLESVPPEAFVRLLNCYKDQDVLARMPGWIVFQPGESGTQYIFSGSGTLQKLAELVRGDGTRVVVGANAGLIKYYDTATNAWITIGTGFSVGVPWQCVALSGYLIFNNAINLPQTWSIGDAAVAPLYELREAGVASVGRISAYNGFLFVGDVVEIIGDHLPLWINGYGSYTSTSNSAKVANFSILTANFRVRFQVTTGASTITATLPVPGVGDFGFYALIEKVDNGAGSVVTSPVLSGEAIVLDSIGDLALLYWNGAAWTSKVFPSGVIPGTDSYGIIADSLNITQHIPDEQAWSELGSPVNWAPLLRAYVNPAGTAVTLPFKPHNWTAKLTRVAVIGAGIGGGTLGGTTLYPDGVMITAIAAFSASSPGVIITLEVTTDVSISYPRLVDVTRWTDVSTFVGKQRLGNGRRITAMVELNAQQIVFHEAGAFLNRYTGNAKNPFALREQYVGPSVPLHGDCIVGINNAYLLFPSVDGSFIRFDGLSDPQIHPLCEGAKALFFSGLAPTDRIWAIDCPAMQAAWFVRPNKVFVYRYKAGTEGVSEMDAQIDAAAFVQKPGGSPNWFILGISNRVFQLAMVNGVISSWLRNGVATGLQITSGLISMKDQMREKLWQSFTPILSSPSADMEFTIQLRGTPNPSFPLVDFMATPAALPDPASGNCLLTCFQSIFVQDEISLTDTRDLDFRLSSRLWEFDVVGGLAVTRGL